jgi:hypothetical protein
MAIEQHEEVTVKVKYARCLNCKHEGCLNSFRLCDQVIEDGKPKKVFDGTYRCPYCGTKDPDTWVDTVHEIRKTRSAGKVAMHYKA